MSVDYSRLEICLGMRVPPAEIFACDCTQIEADQVQALVCSALAPIIALNPHYAQTFLRRYLKFLESVPPIDEIYELFCSPLVLGARELAPTESDTLTYPIDGKGTTVVIRETPKIISGAGTTGLRTWEAALFLLHFLERNEKGLGLSGLHILELGAGTGLVSLALAKRQTDVGYLQITVTDGDTQLLERIPATFADNGLDIGAARVRVAQLVWGDAVGGVDIAPDIVVAADVTYDAGVVPLLADTLADFLQRGTRLCLVAATVRNPSTIAAWEKELDRFSWEVLERLEDPHSVGGTLWFRKGTPEIRVYTITGTKRDGQREAGQGVREDKREL